jgi:hypothetical protein
VNHPGGGRSPGRGGFQFRALPLWAQWVLPFSVAAALVLALVLFVNAETNAPAQASYNSPTAVAEQNREDAILVREQQAPHRATLKAGQSATRSLRISIVGWMTGQINRGAIDGPISHASCRPAGGTRARLLFRCAVTASAQSVTYPFDGVVQPRSRAITWCQRVTPPVPRMNIPVSRRCT